LKSTNIDFEISNFQYNNHLFGKISKEQMPALICDTKARQIICAATMLGSSFAQEQNNPPKYLGNKSEIPLLNFPTRPDWLP